MPLPAVNTPWPLPEFEPALRQIAADDVWLDGDVKAMRDQDDSPRPYQARAQFNGGLVGSMARGVLGAPTVRSDGNARIAYHLPVADALVLESANLLASKPPTITLDEADDPNEQATEALETLTNDDVFAAEWWEACREQSAHGWVYGRVVWNLEVSDRPWIDWVDADQGMAEYANGRVKAITFWDTHKIEKDVYRLLQRHYPGRIDYCLYKGTDRSIGMVVPIDEIEQTAHLADLLDADSGIPTGINQPTAVMIRNLDKNHSWRHHPQLRFYGRSDVAKGGDIWRVINSTWSELQHERTAGRARLMVDEGLLQHGGPGSGQYFDMMRDVFPLAQTGSIDDSAGITPVQFDIRADQYLSLLDAAHRKAIDAVGLSPITVGMDAQATGDMTATETRARSHKTISTHGGKARQARAGLSQLVTAYLQMDAVLNNYRAPERPVNVALVEPVEDTPLDTATRIGNLKRDGLASTAWAVSELHPEWTQAQVEAEVANITREDQAGMPVDPFTIGQPDQPFGEE